MNEQLPSPQETGVPDDMSYNGWTNRSTWAVALWLDNDEPLYRAMQRFARAGDVTAESTERFVTTELRGKAATMLRHEAEPMSLVNWQEIVDDCVLPSIDGDGG